MIGVHPGKVEATNRFAALDGLRALAMLSVFLFHAWLPLPRMIFASWHPLPGVVWKGNSLIANLNIGVSVFFALSGFLIYRPFAAAHLEDRSRPDVARYARRRALRIFPAYWLVFVVLLATGEFAHITVKQVVANLALVQTWFRFSQSSGIGQAWTLVVEVAFYAFVPVWSILVRNVARGRDPFRAELAGTLFLTMVGFGASWWSIGRNPPAWYTAFLPHLAALAPGMLLAVVSVQAARDGRWRLLLARLGRYPVLWWLAAAAGFWIMCAHVAANPYFTLDIHGLGWQDMLQPVIAFLMLAPFVLSPARPDPLHRALSWRPIAWIGTISYGAYLWHGRILDLAVVQRTMFHAGVGRGYPTILAGTALALVLTLFAGAASWYVVERTCMRYSL